MQPMQTETKALKIEKNKEGGGGGRKKNKKKKSMKPIQKEKYI